MRGFQHQLIVCSSYKNIQSLDFVVRYFYSLITYSFIGQAAYCLSRSPCEVSFVGMSEPVQEGDNICRSCTGLLIYTRERNKRGEKPLCIGVSGVAKGRIPNEKLTDLNEKTKVKSKELGTYICFGYSQWSGMMERTGRIPLCISGVQLNIVPRYAPQKR